MTCMTRMTRMTRMTCMTCYMRAYILCFPCPTGTVQAQGDAATDDARPVCVTQLHV